MKGETGLKSFKTGFAKRWVSPFGEQGLKPKPLEHLQPRTIKHCIWNKARGNPSNHMTLAFFNNEWILHNTCSLVRCVPSSLQLGINVQNLRQQLNIVNMTKGVKCFFFFYIRLKIFQRLQEVKSLSSHLVTANRHHLIAFDRFSLSDRTQFDCLQPVLPRIQILHIL